MLTDNYRCHVANSCEHRCVRRRGFADCSSFPYYYRLSSGYKSWMELFRCCCCIRRTLRSWNCCCLRCCDDHREFVNICEMSQHRWCHFGTLHRSVWRRWRVSRLAELKMWKVKRVKIINKRAVCGVGEKIDNCKLIRLFTLFSFSSVVVYTQFFSSKQIIFELLFEV